MLQRHQAFLQALLGSRVQRTRVDAVSRVLCRLSGIHAHRHTKTINVALLLRQFVSKHEQHGHVLQSFASSLGARAQQISRTLIERERTLAERVLIQRESVRVESANRWERTVVVAKERPARVQMVLARPQGVSNAVAPRSDRVDPSPQADPLVRRFDRDTSAVRQDVQVLAPQELSRVTDYVIRQLDRRVLSYRERTGRV
jgi:hypothetical protein